MIRSSFASFNTARMAIQANQSALGIVGHNMANAKTPGYTRQRLDQISLNSTNAPSMFMSNPEAYIGYGVMVTGVSQIRDQFLDTRYRIEMGNLGTYDKKAEILDRIGTIFDETGRTGLDKQFEDFVKQLQSMNNDISNSNDNAVKSSASTLCGLLRKYSTDLKDAKTTIETELKDDIKNVNDLLQKIQKLNEGIKTSQACGNPALELQDDRNLLIDQLATYANIRVDHSTTTTATGEKIDYLTIDYIDATGNRTNLIDDTKPAGSLSLEVVNGKQQLNVTPSNNGTIKKNLLSDKGTLQVSLNMLNNSGEFDALGSEKGIGYYEKVLDEIARSFAEKLNGLNNVAGAANGGNLFESNDPANAVINASNISVSVGWSNGTIALQKSQDPATSPSKDNSNILNMINAMNAKNPFKTNGGAGNTFFTGTFQECCANMTNVQSMEQQSAESTLDNYISIANQISNERDSVSGVNVDEEAMNMMQYNSALTAASRYMTTLDEALNTIINNMGTVGR